MPLVEDGGTGVTQNLCSRCGVHCGGILQGEGVISAYILERWEFIAEEHCSPPGSSVPGILQARILEWATIPFSRNLPNPGIEPTSPALQADSLPTEPQGNPMDVRVGL